MRTVKVYDSLPLAPVTGRWLLFKCSIPMARSIDSQAMNQSDKLAQLPLLLRPRITFFNFEIDEKLSPEKNALRTKVFRISLL
jgi:hypothetical protein